MPRNDFQDFFRGAYTIAQVIRGGINTRPASLMAHGPGGGARLCRTVRGDSATDRVPSQTCSESSCGRSPVIADDDTFG